MNERKLKSQQIISQDSAGRFWLWLDLLEAHDQHVLFIASDGAQRLDLVQTWDCFEWRGVVYEVQGFDRPNRRAWVEPVEIPDERQVKPAGKDHDPRDDDGRPGWSRSAA